MAERVGLRAMRKRVVSAARPSLASAFTDQPGGSPDCAEDPVARKFGKAPDVALNESDFDPADRWER